MVRHGHVHWHRGAIYIVHVIMHMTCIRTYIYMCMYSTFHLTLRKCKPSDPSPISGHLLRRHLTHCLPMDEFMGFIVILGGVLLSGYVWKELSRGQCLDP